MKYVDIRAQEEEWRKFMGLDFNRAETVTASTGGFKSQTEPEEVQPYDIVADREQMNTELVNSPEVDNLCSQIEVFNLETIVSFGSEAAEEISRASDIVLNSMNMSQLDDSSEMLNTLAKIMNKFDIEEIKENPGLFGKLFGNLRKQLDKILAKYHTMGEEVDKIYVQLKQYESEIKQSNRKLDEMFQANVTYYHQLVKYILAGEQGCRELAEYIAQRRSDVETSGDNSIQFELQSLEQAQMMLEQRVQDLRTAESVAMQSIPMIKTMEFSNMNLVRKINSAFIITLPVFKQALAQAIMLKRQKIQAEAMSALDQKTNEMLIKNARNTVEQSKMTARMASGSSIKIETLETTWRTIVNGIDETKQIQENARKQRVEDQARLQTIKNEFNQRYNMPDRK
ncbi:toxic anion resistance protein TelA [Blautia hydrogenotrophica DSM 10507]|uniref:TelA-like protein SA1238 n=2 Tax=Blautia hydrogenotrophica TaxID=53443 RepID=C0CIL9_BLAHS|nr:toxic anion resistance protein TelA [Blautia hydrogenotrophica DSM 10507]